MIKILSPAKINLFLEIGGLGKKLHNLMSLVDIVSLYDEIRIEESVTTEVLFHSEWTIPAENTVTRTISLLRRIFNVNKGVRIEILKKIPPGSGLGGGSSNAASVLRALLKIWKIDLGEKRLTRIASLVGSDVPLFIQGGRCIVEGTGNKIEKKGVSGMTLAYYLSIPPFSVSTREVYSRLDSLKIKGNLTEAREKIKLLNEEIELKHMENIEKIMQNRLEEPYFDLYNQAKGVKRQLERHTGKKFFVSGSGGTLFSVFPDRRDAETRTSLFNAKGWKSCIVESIKTS